MPAVVVALFYLGQVLAACVWLLMVFAPRSGLTLRVAASWMPLLAIGFCWALLMAYGFAHVDPIAATLNALPPTLRGVAENLSLPALVPGSWTHYTVLDLFAGRWMFLREKHRGVLLSAVLLLTYAAGPAGLLIYLVWLGVRGDTTASEAA